MADFAIIKANIEADFPGWTVWLSDGGRWYATRAGTLTDQQLRSGLARTLAADGPDELRGLLTQQPDAS